MFRDEEKGLWSAALRKGKYKLIWGQSKLLKQKVFKKLQNLNSLFIFLAVMMQMPKDANNRELYNVIDDPNETKNLVRFEICFITCQNKFKSLRILFDFSIYMNGSINKTFCLQAGSNPEIVLELQKILRRIEPQMASARYVFKIANEMPK